MNNSSFSRLDQCGKPVILGDSPDSLRLVAGICFPLLLILCTVGNLLNILVLMRNAPKSTADVYMISLAVSDLTILWLFLPQWIKRLDPTFATFSVGFGSFDKTWIGLYPPFVSVFYFTSNWIVVVFSMERLLVVWKPLYFLGRLKALTALTAVIFLFIIGIIKSLFQLIEFLTWRTTNKPSRQWPLIRATHYPDLNNWAPIQAIFTVVDPMVCFAGLIIINGILICQLTKRKIHRKRELQTGQLSGHTNSHSSTIILSMGSACLFLVCKVPAFVYNSLLLASRQPFCSYVMSHSTADTWVEFVWLFNTINYSVNFYLYCAISKKFRQQLNTRFPGLVRLAWWKRGKTPETSADSGGSVPATPLTGVSQHSDLSDSDNRRWSN